MENIEGVGPSPSRFDPERAPLSEARARVLEAMQRLAAASSASDVAAALGLHENTARKHLEGLAERGLLARTIEQPEGRGRPAIAYRALPQHTEPDARVREYVGLAAALAGHIAATSEDPEADAIAAGERWAESVERDEPPSTKQPIEIHIIKAFDAMGFEPELDEAGDSIALTRCPLIDAALAEPTVVCGVHFGFARGLLRARGADVSRARLTPFSEVGACRLHLR